MDMGMGRQQQMEAMHNICQNELQQLQINIKTFLDKSADVKKLLNANGRRKTEDNNVFALIAFDSYMTQISTIITMVRKLNIHLQLNAFPKSCLNAMEPSDDGFGYCMSKSRLYQDFVQWSSVCMGMGREIDEQSMRNLSFPAEGVSQERQTTIEQCSSENLVRKSLGNISLNVSDFDEYLHKILPTKNLSHFKDGHVFSASITHVKDLNKLIFFVWETNDFHTLLEISSPSELLPIQRSDMSDKIFFITESHFKNGGKCEEKRAWRAIMVPEDLSKEQSVLLIDSGEILTLNEKCKLYKISPKLADIPPVAIKCILEGVYDSDGLLTTDHEKCQTVLLSNEFKMANFRVLSQESGALRVILLDPNPEKKSILSSAVSRSKSNPFIDSTLMEEDDESDDKSGPMPLHISAVFTAQPPKRKPKPTVNYKIGEILKVTVSHIISPIQFYAIIEDKANAEICEVFFWSDDEILPGQKQMLAPEIDDVILARYIKDDYWYRAKVVHIMPDRKLYKVFYIDYGNTEIVPLSSMALCNSHQIEIPPQAIPFRLGGLELVHPNGNVDGADDVVNNKLQKATEAVVVAITNQTLNVEVVDLHHSQWDSDEVIVRLEEQFSFIPSMILNMGVAVKAF